MKPIVFNYQEYEAQKAKIADLTAENEELKEQVANLQIRCRIAEEARETAYWTDSIGNKDDFSEWCVYCSSCKSQSEERGRYCPICGRKMDNPEPKPETREERWERWGREEGEA